MYDLRQCSRGRDLEEVNPSGRSICEATYSTGEGMDERGRVFFGAICAREIALKMPHGILCVIPLSRFSSSAFDLTQ